jgi:GNAT superfamily N-acetyltransferase
VPQIISVDPDDDDALAAWYATYYASTVHGREHATPWMLDELRPQLQATDTGSTVLAWSAVEEGEVVAIGTLTLPQRDNLEQAWLEVHTHPAHRRRGHGSAVLEHLVAVARAQGRRVLQAESPYPYDGPADGAGSAGAEFLAAHGFALGLADVQRVLDLPADTPRLQRLAEEVAPHHAAYVIRQFTGPVPDDLVPSFGVLLGALMTEAPTGEMVVEREVYDVERIRAGEQLLAAAGRTRYTTVAVDGGGDAVAYSELVVPGHDPGRAYQWGTLVLPEHRGHRLGLATKVHNLLWLQQERPDLHRVVTYNADSNRHMIAVNEELGFRSVERLGEFQRILAD